MALGADNGAAWQADRSNTALASIMLMSLAGRVPNDQLLRIVRGCL